MRFFYWRSANRGSPAETCYLISGRSGDGILSGSPKISHCSSPKSPGGHITTSEGLSSARSAAGNLTAQSLNIHLMMVVPHITDAIQEWIERVAVIPVDGMEGLADVCVIELGGTTGDCLMDKEEERSTSDGISNAY